MTRDFVYHDKKINVILKSQNQRFRQTPGHDSNRPKPGSSGYRPMWLRPVQYERMTGLQQPIGSAFAFQKQEIFVICLNQLVMLRNEASTGEQILHYVQNDKFSLRNCHTIAAMTSLK